MNFSVTGDHRQFFRTHQWIECEGVISPTVVEKVYNECSNVLSNRTNLKSSSLPAEKAFSLGRDLWRQSPSLKKIFLQKGLAEIASGLAEQQKLRFGFDQYIPSFSAADNNFINQSFMLEPLTLSERVGIQYPLCGAMLCIKGYEKNDSLAEENCELFSQIPGNAVFFSPECPLDFSPLIKMKGAVYIMLVYVSDVAVYYKQEMDPQGNALRKLGYNFGDRLKEHTHPTVHA